MKKFVKSLMINVGQWPSYNNFSLDDDDDDDDDDDFYTKQTVVFE